MLLSTPAHDPATVAPNFSLVDVVSGDKVSLSEADTSNGFVVAFICNHCPYVQAIIEQFVEVAGNLKDQGIPVFAIMSNNYEFVTEDSPENMKQFAAEHNFSFPYLVDEDQSVATAYDAVCTPDVFGFNSEGKMQYRGDVKGLQSAMEQIAQTETGPTEQTPSQGCSIKWK